MGWGRTPCRARARDPRGMPWFPGRGFLGQQKPRAKYLGVIVIVMVVVIAVIAVIAVIVLAGDHCRSAERKKEEGSSACPGGKTHNPFHVEAQMFARGSEVYPRRKYPFFGKSQF